jgi:hypothetical protein
MTFALTSHTTNTQPHTDNDAALSPFLTLSSTHTHRTHSIIQVSFSWFFTSLLQRWSRHREDCSVIQEQYLLGVWRSEASRGLWLNAWHGINAPRNEGRSSCQDHAHQESHVFRFKVVQCSSLYIVMHYTSSHNLRMHSFAKHLTPVGTQEKQTREFECFLVRLRLHLDMRLSWCFSQHVLRKWHYYPWVFWTCVHFVYVSCSSNDSWCVYVMCLGGEESALNVSFIYMSLNISAYLARSHALSFSQVLASTGMYSNCSLRWKSLWHWGVWRATNVMLPSEIRAANSLG